MKRELLVSCEYKQKQVAIIEDGNLEEFYIEDDDAQQLVGSIYKGRVSSVVPGIGASFVTIGLEKNGFLYVGDVVGEAVPMAPGEEEIDFDREVPQGRERNRKRGERRPRRRIEELLKPNQEILVQIVKEPFGTKGARLTSQISLAGRYVVMMPFSAHSGISKRIESRRERERIREMLRGIAIPKDVGVIVRTAAIGCEKNALERDIKFLLNQWKLIRRRSAVREAPSLLHEEYGITLRMVRDVFNDRFHSVTIEGREEFRKTQHYMKAAVPQLLKKLHLYKGESPLFRLKNVEKELERVQDSKVILKSGGSIVIEQTEALVSIDVNTGKFTGNRNLEDTAYRTNCEAAREIAKQIRLRDLGGIIIIDFIDMERADHRRSVIKILDEVLLRDRAKTSVLNLSQLGLVEMTRQRIRKSFHITNTQKCPYCQGTGMVKSNKRLAVEALEKAESMLKRFRGGTVEVTAAPGAAGVLLASNRSMMKPVEQKMRGRIFIMADPHIHPEELKVKRIYDRRRHR